MGVPDTSSTSSLAIWILVVLVLFGGGLLAWAGKVIFNNIIDRLNENSEFNKLATAEMRSIWLAIKELQDTQKFCDHCPK